MIAPTEREQPSRDGLLGTWRSDREKTLESWHFQDRSIPPESHQRFAELFGRLTYLIGRHTSVIDESGCKTAFITKWHRKMCTALVRNF
ncbi:MAG: hypothetical protein ABI809_05890 [Caldimonas sp.]